MVAVAVFANNFERAVRKLNDNAIKERIKRQVAEILERPDIGKPLRFDMKGERCVYVPPFRIIYAVQGNTVYFLDFDKRDRVYR